MANEPEDTIRKSAACPAKAAGDDGSVEQHKLPEQIAAGTKRCRHFYTTPTEHLRDVRILRREECRHCGRKLANYEAKSIGTSPRAYSI